MWFLDECVFIFFVYGVSNLSFNWACFWEWKCGLGHLLESFHQDSRACHRHLRACCICCSVLVNQHSDKLISTKYFIRVYFTLGFCWSGFGDRFQFTVGGVFKFLKKFWCCILVVLSTSVFNEIAYVRYLLT